MDDIELIIKIPEEVYRAYIMDASLSFLNMDQKQIAYDYLIAGLLKGHRYLKDENKEDEE